jgi:hypothetical protein
MKRITASDIDNARKFVEMKTESPLVEIEQALTIEALRYWDNNFISTSPNEEVNFLIEVSDMWKKYFVNQ